jgi:hypothetical protein
MNGGGASLYDSDGSLILGKSTQRDWSLPEFINK